ncbi:hypothetical protein ACHQM5_007467 [Ranunculus cassubicifolius]
MAENKEMDETRNLSTAPIYFEDLNKKLSDRLEKQISSMPSSNCSIYRVPRKFFIIGEEDTYTPRVISIGPYHHGKQHLKAFEQFKIWYLHSFISRSPDTHLSDYVNAIRKIETSIRECYTEPIELSSDDFVRTMVLDGCFILELLNKYQEEDSKMDSKDCLFKSTWTVPSLRRDLVLLENQVPFILLDHLFNLSMCRKNSLSLSELILNFFDPILPSILVTSKDHSFKGKHVLDLLRNYLLFPYQAIEDTPICKYTGEVTIFQPSEVIYFGDSPMWEYITCAMSLQKAGVKFKRKDTANGLLDITFRNGIVEMPPFCVGESWTILFPNLIALEQCRRDYPDKITSYVILMNRLINSRKDVKLLCNTGIIDGLYMKDEKVVRVIDKICEEVIVDNFYYDGLCNKINAYCRRRRNKWGASLKKVHSRIPWQGFFFVALLTLFLLTVAEIIRSD